LIELFDRLAQMPARLRKDQEIVNIARIDEVTACHDRLGDCVQVERREQRTECAAAVDTLLWGMEQRAVDDRVVKDLMKQIEQPRVGNIGSQLPEQDRFVEIGVVLPDICPEDERVLPGAHEPMHTPDRRGTTAVATHMFASALHGQTVLQEQRQALNHQRIGCRPDDDGFARCFRDARHRLEAIRSCGQRLTDTDSFVAPMKPQVPGTGVIGIVPALRAQPSISVIDEGIGQIVERESVYGRAKRNRTE
jgi:hypothetical protein